MSVEVHHGDSREILKTLADNSIDACTSDPPYALTSVVKRFGAENAAPAKATKTGAYARASAGFMGQKWDTGETAFDPEFWREVYRVLKPGGFVVAFGGTRTYHRLATAIEAAGFEIRDAVQWLYGSGFPKSHDAERAVAVETCKRKGRHFKKTLPATDRRKGDHICKKSAASARHEGHGTALKPACEIICLARKPMIGTLAENLLAWGTGALNIDGCRVHADDAQGFAYQVKRWKPGAQLDREGGTWKPEGDAAMLVAKPPVGRWPANVITDGSPEVIAAFPEAVGQQGVVTGNEPSTSGGIVYGKRRRTASGAPRDGEASANRRYTEVGATNFAALPGERRDDEGSAARFFYTAKADATERLGALHPTVKPIGLMGYLIRLVTPSGGTVLDPFAGTGTTGVAAIFEGFSAVLIEREATFVADIERRLAWARGEGRLTALEKRQPKEREPTGIDRSLFDG